MGAPLTDLYEELSDIHAFHLATRQVFKGKEAEKVLGKGHTPKMGYFAPGSGTTLEGLTREDYLGWVMHTARRLHYLGRISVDDQGTRNSVGRQAAWGGVLEADLFL